MLDTVAVQSPLAGISTTDPTAMEPSVYIDKEKTNPMDSSPDINRPPSMTMDPPVDINTAIDKMTVKEDEEGTLDSNPPEPSPRGKIKRNKFVEYKESDLPDTEARLTDDQNFIAVFNASGRTQKIYEILQSQWSHFYKPHAASFRER